MSGKFLAALLGALLFALGAVGLTSTALAQMDEGYEHYGYYDVGFDDRDVDDDWFFDYYEWNEDQNLFYDEYGYDYDWDADAFDWEEDGLFE